MVFFFDQANGYVLAESTQSHHSGHAGDLWLGCTIIPRGLSVCEHTVNIPEANKGSNQFFDNAGDIHIINDLAEDARFRDRPYVHQRPNARFYAGVPIKTPGGANIGAFCVLDVKPRPGLADDDVDFLKHMGSLVMNHLDHLRTSAEYGRGARMLEGLGIITRHEESATAVCSNVRQGKSQESTKISSVEQSEVTETHAELLSGNASDHAPERGDRPRRMRALYKTQVARSSSITQSSAKVHSTHETAPPAIPIESAPSHKQASTWYSNEQESSQKPLDSQIKESFQTASCLLLDAVKSDGVAFLDATSSRASTSSFANRRFTGMENTSATEDSDSPAAHAVVRDHTPIESAADCEVLGHSEVEDLESGTVFNNLLTERLLKTLMRRYPQGKTWTFDAHGEESTDDLLEGFIDNPPSGGPIKPPDTTTHNQLSSRDAARLLKLFRCKDSSSIRTICFAPMWDPVRERWYAAVLTWSKSARHGFSRNNELSYLRAFCDVTMADVLRIEAKHEARAKSSLISSVSHELRSPLHGILGSVDLLKSNGAFDWSLIEQIQKCSLNLVDVIDHLLDFAQINSKAPRSKRSLAKSPLTSKACSRISLARTTEEIVDAVYYAHNFTNRDRRHAHVDLIVDLAPASATECLISVGAWKRLCTNIVNNALKYTHEGHVKVDLDVEQREGGGVCATLTVADTGIGMSPEFLKTRLFESFAQEDSLATGTGLGMSLVAQLIKDFRGTIEVQSEKGEGTTMTLTIPLEVDSRGLEVGFSTDIACHGCRVGFMEQSQSAPDFKPSSSRTVLTDTAKNTLRNIGATICAEADADMVAIMEEDLDHLLADQQAIDERRLLVLCRSFASAARVRDKYQLRHARFVPQPYGPERLSAAVRSLSKSVRNDSVRGSRRASGEQGKSNQPPRALALEGDVSIQMSALPSPPLDLGLGDLTLGGLADAASNVDSSITKRPEAPLRDVFKDTQGGASNEGSSALKRRSLSEQQHAGQPAQRSDLPLLLLVDDNVSAKKNHKTATY